MRIKGEKVDIDYAKTRAFFDSRGEKYNEEHPYVTTMYQDSQPQLTDERNRAEVEKILPLLELGSDSRILDLGCGIGRWADAIQCGVGGYLGIDFSGGFIEIAQKRNRKLGFDFVQASVCDFGEYFRAHELQPFNRLIAAGILIYLNDADVEALFRLLSEILAPNALAYIREPVGIQERLTLKDFFSQELKHDYHTIYRTEAEYRSMLETAAPGFQILQSGFLFDRPLLNNRRETSQYYYLIKRNI
ncbi:MAG: methyltransferase domain-containing protein [Oscillospiraceae bacterium]|nr:methyltransferase domain-containing protein [Oscillospiraceae bacterium]